MDKGDHFYNRGECVTKSNSTDTSAETNRHAYGIDVDIL